MARSARMLCTRRTFCTLACASALAGLSACSCSGSSCNPSVSATAPHASTVDKEEFKSLALDMDKWLHDDEHDVWYQTGLAYCKTPATKVYETLAIYVPGKYFTGVKKGDTYTCTVNREAVVGAYSAMRAPFVMPVNAPGYAAQSAPAGYLYEGLEPYLSAGLIYVYAGLRGRSGGYDSSAAGAGYFPGGAPWAVVDLKAAIRYLRYNAKVLPGDTGHIVPFGHAAGGSIVATVGASGDAKGFVPYLEMIGAATHDAEGVTISDAVEGVALWCPEGSLDAVDAAYEWEVGQHLKGNSRTPGVWTDLLSGDLARAYATYCNGLGLVSSRGEALTLDQTDGGIYCDGTFYSYLLSLIEQAFASFLSTATFPYTVQISHMASGVFPGSGIRLDEARARADVQERFDAHTQPPTTTYASVDEYIRTLNTPDPWFTYNHTKGTVRIASLRDFVMRFQQPVYEVCSFDGIKRHTTRNQLFGCDTSSTTAHFSRIVCDQLVQHHAQYASADGWDAAYVGDWESDLGKKDVLSKTVDERRSLCDPLSYVCGTGSSFGSATVAPHWRINTGLAQRGASVALASQLPLALGRYDGVTEVSYTPVWDKGCELAERSGDAVGNFIAWIATFTS